jgi:two-component system, LytTR family, sensor kinase
MVGIFLLAKFNTLFKGVFKNEWVRKNILVWLIIFLLSGALYPLSSGFFFLLQKYGWWGIVWGHLISTTASTLLIYNVTSYVIEHRVAKKLSFLKHKLLVIVVVTILTLAVNVPLVHIIYDKSMGEFIKYNYVSSVYFGVIAGLIYALFSYLGSEQQRRFDEKELELSRLRELKTKAELDALHSKINPHFLYNALNSIADLSITDGKKARKMTIALADLFRYSINYSNNNYSTVKEEVEMTDVYLHIEKIRFEDQLTYSLEVDKELNHYLVPRFVLQPIVENAVKHGLKAKGKMTEIKVKVSRRDDGLQLTIADNGPAFPAALSPGYGVKSIYDKLELLFPGNFEVQFINEPNKQVSIYINKLMKDEPSIQDNSDR